MKRKLLILFLTVCLVMSAVAACGTSDTTAPSITSSGKVNQSSSFIFTDSLDRNVEIPTNVTQIALSGPLTQIVLFALCPDKLVGLATDWDSSAEEFLKTEYYKLPVLGQLYGGKGTLNLETIVATGAQLIIDVGEAKSNTIEDMDNLQAQLNIPTVHIDAYIKNLGDTYRNLGELLNMEKEAEVLAKYCDKVYANTISIMSKVGENGKVELLYCSGEKGLNVIAKGSYQAELIDMLANNLAVVDNPSSKGTGNEVDLEQIMLWNPDVIFFAPASIYRTVQTNADWASISAIKNKKYYEVPYCPYNWLGFPPSVQRYLGMIWMAQLLYPDIAQYDVYNEVSKYFDLFYHCKITKEQYNKLVANSLGKQ